MKKYLILVLFLVGLTININSKVQTICDECKKIIEDNNPIILIMKTTIENRQINNEYMLCKDCAYILHNKWRKSDNKISEKDKEWIEKCKKDLEEQSEIAKEQTEQKINCEQFRKMIHSKIEDSKYLNISYLERTIKYLQDLSADLTLSEDLRMLCRTYIYELRLKIIYKTLSKED